MRVAVTGAAGFLGGAVAEAHRDAGHDVVALSRDGSSIRGVDHRTGDLRDAAYVAAALDRVDAVQHIAARVGTAGPMSRFELDNVVVTEQLLRAAASAGVRAFVSCSSPSVVFDGRPIRGADESLPRRPLRHAPYPTTKARAEEAVEQIAPALGLPAIILRPHLIWGPGDRHLLPGLQRAARLGWLPRPSGPDPMVDPTYVDDAARAHLAAAIHVLATSPSQVSTYFVTGREQISVWDMAQRLLAAGTGSSVETVRLPAALFRAAGWIGGTIGSITGGRVEVPVTRFTVESMLHDEWFSTSAIERDLGFRPETSIEVGLEAVAAARVASATQTA